MRESSRVIDALLEKLLNWEVTDVRDATGLLVLWDVCNELIVEEDILVDPDLYHKVEDYCDEIIEEYGLG